MTTALMYIILGLGLAYWAWMMVDLASHSLAAGPNEGGALFRWLSALTGTFTIITALFILRQDRSAPPSHQKHSKSTM